MKTRLRLLSLLLVLLLTAACLPLQAAAGRTHYDSVSGATSGGGHDDDDDDTPSSFGNSAVDISGYTLAPYDASGLTGTALALLMNESPVFYYDGSVYTQLMYYCIKGYAYMFYLYGSSYADYVGISYGYEAEIESKTASVWASLYIGVPGNNGGSDGNDEPSGDTCVYVGTASVDDAEGSFLTLNVSVSQSAIADISADDAACVGTWGSLIDKRRSEYVGKSTLSADEFDAVTSATVYSAAVKEAVLDALELSPSVPVEPVEPDEPDDASPKHVKTLTGSDGNYVISLNVTAENNQSFIPGMPSGANIVLVVDVSGSIADETLDNLNAAIHGLTSNLPKHSQLGLVAFADGVSEGMVYSSPNEVPEITLTGGATYLAPALSAADALLDNTVLWDRPDNAKVMIVISDGQICDPDDALYRANAIKTDAHIYTVNVASTEAYIPDEALWIAGSYGSGSDYGMATLQAVSSNYLEPGIESVSFIYNQYSFGASNPDGNSYAYGTNGADWLNILTEIAESEAGQTVEVPMTNVVITDILSEYVDLSFNASETHGITVEGTDDYTVTVDGKTVSVAFGGELTADVTYTVYIPVTANAAAQAAANAAESEAITLPSNAGAALAYSYGEDSYSVDYAQSPTFTMSKQAFTVTVHYLYFDGTTAAPDAVEVVACGAEYSIPSPVIRQYQPDFAEITGVMGTADAEYTVTYYGTFVWGDVDCDGDCDWADVAMLYQFMVGAAELTPQGIVNANVAGSDPYVTPPDMQGIDDSITFSDVVAVYNYLLCNVSGAPMRR